MGLPQSCSTCTFGHNPKAGNFTKLGGKGTNRILLVGAWSSYEEALFAVTLHPDGSRGHAFRTLAAKAGMKPEDFYAINILRCRPPREDDWAPGMEQAIHCCAPNFEKILEETKPKLIVALGSFPLRVLANLSPGKKTSVEYLRGYLLQSKYGIPMVATFDPLFISRGKASLTSLVVRDLIFARDAVKYEYEPVVDLGSEVSYSAVVGDAWKIQQALQRDPSQIVSFDIETDYSEDEAEDELISLNSDQEDDQPIEEEDSSSNALDTRKAQVKSVQFSIAPGTGVYLRWPQDRAVIETILQSPNPKVGHNCWNFDCPILRAHGLTINGTIHDTMWMWHHIQPDLPAHLQGVAVQYGMSFPWKHFSSSSPEFYGAADVDATLRIYQGLRKDLESKGIWESYQTYVQSFRSVLDRMEQRGIPINAQLLSDFRGELEEELIRISNEIQQITPRGVLPLKWTGKPKVVGEWLKTNLLPLLLDPTLPKSKQPKLKDAWEDVTRRGEMLEQIKIQLGWEYSPEKSSWFYPLPFNPKSTQQMQAYITYRGYRMPTRFKDGAATTGTKELEKLARTTGDPMFKLVTNQRAVAKMGDSYAGKRDPVTGISEGGWIPHSDGRLRATFTFGPATWQLAAKSPNVLTTPKRNPALAKRFRRCIEAPSGYRLIEFDFQSFHALTTALEAQDLILARMAKLDIHSFVAGHLVHYPGIETCLDLSDKDLKTYLKEVRAAHPKVRDYQAKPAVHGTNFGQGYRRLYFEYSDHFSSESEAKHLLDLLRDLFPKLFAWQHNICLLAGTQGYLISRWKGIRWFWDALKWQKNSLGKWEQVPGRDAEKAKAFLPANDAHGMLRQKLLEMEQLGWNERYGLINAIHDAVLFCCPEPLVEEAVHNVRELLTAPVIELSDPIMCPDGFVCGVDAAVGQDWSKMEEQ